MNKIEVIQENTDVAIIAGPRVDHWPSVGMRTLSAVCSDLGLKVSLLGGEKIDIKGVVAQPGTGGIVVGFDQRHRVQRINARAVVKFRAPLELPDPFPGLWSDGLVPLRTARILMKETSLKWAPTTVVLGSSNPALRFAAELIETRRAREVYCVETRAEGWGEKAYSGWEVEMRRFLIAGGRFIVAKPLSLKKKAAMQWELRLQDEHGVRVMDTARVVAAGPFSDVPGVREYPPGSFLFEIDQTALASRSDDVEGWANEEERGRWLGGRISKALLTDFGTDRGELEWIFRRAKLRLRSHEKHHAESFSPKYEGKWLVPDDVRRVRSFVGVPQQAHKFRSVASLECFEDIPCNLCEKSCPESAIKINRSAGKDTSFLIESDCTSCGLCLTACPSGAILMVHENEQQSMSQLTFVDKRGGHKVGEHVELLNRRGEFMGTGRISSTQGEDGSDDSPLIQVDVPGHLVWDVRGYSIKRKNEIEEISDLSTESELTEKVEIELNGTKRLVRKSGSLSLALFDLGLNRSGDALLCSDGSCGRCELNIDGAPTLACQAKIQKGMRVEFKKEELQDSICPCVGASLATVRKRIEDSKLQSPDSVSSVTHVGKGSCHGQLCSGPLRRLFLEQGIDADQWIDWSFPWENWTFD